MANRPWRRFLSGEVVMALIVVALIYLSAAGLRP
jgi:hypothetical protein